MDKKTLIKIGSVALFIIVAVLFIVILFNNSTDNNADSEQVSTVQVVQTTEQISEHTTEHITDDADTTTEESTTEEQTESSTEIEDEEYSFRNNNRLEEHYEKHGKDMGFRDAQEYEEAASDVVNNPEALHKTEKEDGDDVYYVEDSNEFVVVSTDGYIRTYFNPDDGINYYYRQ